MLNPQNILEIIFEASEEFIFILDEKGLFLRINENGARALGYSQGELLGKHFFHFVAERDKKKIAEYFNNIMKSNYLSGFEAALVAKNGKEIIFNFNCRSDIDNGIVLGMLGVGKNITAIIESKEKLKKMNTLITEANRIIEIERSRSDRQKSILHELNRMKSEFISNISHEFRTPLASIIGFSETIAADKNLPEDMKFEFNNIILNEGKRLARLINDVLDLSKIEEGKIRLNKSEFDLVKLFDDIIKNFNEEIQKKNIHLSLNFPPENIPLYADKERILQVFNGLLSNAIKFTPENGRISIYIQSLYKECEVMVTDTGMGIAPKDLPHIFSKFYRASGVPVDKPGAGIGLVFVKQIVDLHKGFINIQSDVNKGTTVIVKLPRNFKK
jgi:PAS domain S-box-containing protein